MTDTDVELGYFTRRGEIRYRASGIVTAAPYPTKRKPGPLAPRPYAQMVEDLPYLYRYGMKVHMVEMERLLNHWGDWVDHWEDGKVEFRWIPFKDMPERRDEIEGKFARYAPTEQQLASGGGFEKWGAL